MTDLLTTYLAIQALGLAGLPLAALALRGLPDGGHSLSKPLGLLLAGFVAWTAAMLGLGPFGAGSMVAGAALGAAAGLWLWGGPGPALNALRRAWAARRGAVVASEAIFLAGLLFVAWMRSYDSAPFGTERPMDFAFFNAMASSASFPPNDPWLAGYSINYYYLGYLLMAGVAALSGAPPTVAYNLSLALIFALAAQAVAGLVMNMMELAAGSGRQTAADDGRPHDPAAPAARRPPSLGARLLVGLLAVSIALVAGNQAGAIQVLLGDERAVALDSRQLLAAARQAAAGASQIALPHPAQTGDFGSFASLERTDRTAPYAFSWWWPSRALWDDYPDGQRRYNITEFPLFSFRLGDMHPHVMALPFGALAIGLALATLARPGPPALARGRLGWADLLAAGLIIGGLYPLNSWDLPTYLLLFAAALALAHLRPAAPDADADAVRTQHAASLQDWRAGFPQAPDAPADAPAAPRGALRAIGRDLALLAAAAYLLYLPFHLTFRSLVGGMEPLIDLPILGRITSVIAPYAAARTGLHEFLIIFGLVALPVALLVYLAGGPKAGLAAWAPPALLLIGLPLGFPLLALAGLGWLALAAAYRRRADPALAMGLLLATLGCAVLFGTELVYIRDVFGTRMNTVFKFYYQVWLIWGLLAPFALWWALARAAGPARLAALGAAGLSAALLAGALVYPALTLRDLSAGQPVGLAAPTPREASGAGRAAIDWLRDNAAPGSVVLEAAELLDPAAGLCGGSYDVYSRGYGGVSSATGLPTLLGWRGHQDQWRGGDPAAQAELGPRCLAVQTIYGSPDPAAARDLIAEYGVDYIYIGELERSLYPPEGLAKLDQLGGRVFDQGGVTILRVGG